MGDWNHMGRVGEGTVKFGMIAVIAILVLAPLAVWKAIDILLWLMQ